MIRYLEDLQASLIALTSVFGCFWQQTCPTFKFMKLITQRNIGQLTFGLYPVIISQNKMQDNSNILYIPEYIQQQVQTLDTKSYPYLTYLILRQSQKCQYLVYISYNINQQSPSLPKNTKTASFQIVNSIDCYKDSMKTITAEEMSEILRKYFVLHILMSGFKGFRYKIIGFSMNDEDDNLLGILKEIKKQYNDVWNKFSSIYNRSLKQNTKTKNQMCGSISLLQFQATALMAPLSINQNDKKQAASYYQQISFLIDINDIEQNPKLLLNFIQDNLTKISSDKNPVIQSTSHLEYLSNINFVPLKIFNPHIFLKPIHKEKFELFLVKGAYEYYHYTDQNFSDHGWGCAYRACQTLLSWLHIQGYTEKMDRMLTIPEIQQKIDSIDLSRRLKGKNDWIGATQISWIVPKLTKPQINCKILHVSDGKQILDKCQEFKYHFLTVGSPIMYGGGQYAYSIVGMYYNWKLGECEFLILDPHYTGEDDYKKIIEKKGLCWRKPQQMFKKGIFYNFCMPIIK